MDSEVESTEPRTAYEVISDAIRENRFSEYLLYFFSGAFVVCGLGVLIVSMLKGQDVTAIVGGVASALFYPAIREARKIRDKNMSIRLLEIPLNKASTAEEAAAALQRFFLTTIQEEAHSASSPSESKSLGKRKGGKPDAISKP